MNPAVLSGQTSLLVTFIASFLIYFMVLGLFYLWLIDGNIKKEQVLHAILSALLAWAATEMIKNVFPIPRPFELNGSLPLTITIPKDGSFPSEHAAVAFGIAGSLWLHNKKTGVAFFIIALLIGWGRVMSQVHSFADIFGGALIGVVTSYIVVRLHLFKLLK